VPLGADEGELGNSIRTADTLSGRLQAPVEPGLYEVRYILNEGRRTLASVQVEILEAEVSIEAPPVVRVTEDLRVAWSNTIDGRDFITIVPLGADEGTIGSSIRASTGSPADLQAPAEPGLYEVRYVLNEGRRTLASATVEVVAADVPINQGAELQVPDTVAPGATITVNWTGGVAGGDQRVALAMPSQPDFTWIEAQPTTEGPPLEFQAPMEPGTYEFRYLDIDNREVLSRVTFEVK
jgi:Ca-activated chloride channel family protein